MADFQNSADQHAVAVRTDLERMLVGYVPRYLALDVWRLASDCGVNFIELFVEGLNLNAPLQNRVLCRLRACWPDNFQPCSSEDFCPIPALVEADCHTGVESLSVESQ